MSIRRIGMVATAGLAVASVAAFSPAAPAAAPSAPEPEPTETASADPEPERVDLDYLKSVPTLVSDLAQGLPLPQALRVEELALTGASDGSDIPVDGSGNLEIVPGDAPAPDSSLRPFTVAVRVEEGLPVDAQDFADLALMILNDPRGWSSIDGVSFARTDDPEAADAFLTLASPSTTEELCGELPTGGYTSCGRVGNINLNAARWVHNAEAFEAAGGSAEEYRYYLINHETGHLLGHWHESCPAAGETAPVMLQQTLDLQGCTPNGWPNADAGQ